MLRQKSEKMTTIFEIQNGKIVYIERKEEDKEFTELLFNKTMNLLENSSMACLFMNKLFRNIVIEDKTIYKKELFQVGFCWGVWIESSCIYGSI